ncbi:MAG: phosphoribosyltransferase [Candidatus Bathyarchaeota archaeon]|nr:phosphoribosyltransferase [Candidatus Bathyarchaeum sp.]
MKHTNTQPHSSEDKLETPSWEQVYSLLLKLANSIQKSNFKPDIIVGVSRGGWIPARILSDLLEKHELANVTAQFYVGIGETKPEPTITQPVSVRVKDKQILLVDDLADSGKSLKLVNEHLKNQGASEIRIATIYRKPWSITTPHYCVKETNHWIVFPWELKETVRKTVEKFTAKQKSIQVAKEKLISSGLDRTIVEQLIKEIIGEQR